MSWSNGTAASARDAFRPRAACFGVDWAVDRYEALLSDRRCFMVDETSMRFLLRRAAGRCNAFEMPSRSRGGGPARGGIVRPRDAKVDA